MRALAAARMQRPRVRRRHRGLNRACCELQQPFLLATLQRSAGVTADYCFALYVPAHHSVFLRITAVYHPVPLVVFVGIAEDLTVLWRA